MLTDLLIILLVLSAAGALISRLHLPHPLPGVLAAVLIIVAAITLIDLMISATPSWISLLRRH